MIRRIARAGLACLFAATLIVPAFPTMACGPDFTPPVLTGERGPDLPPESYAAGRIGVILPSYGEAHLVIAYRYFSDRPLNPVEQRAYVALWNHYHPGQETADEENRGEAEWETAQKLLEPSSPSSGTASGGRTSGQVTPVNLPQTYDHYDNCLDDAYRTAAQTLRDRVREFGAASAAVKSWVEAQRTVFENCEGGVEVPEAADAAMPATIRADREYQIAAANFYAGKWDQAEEGFLAISADASSGWRATAGLVAARCEIRKATLGTDDPAGQQKIFQVADAQLRTIISDPAFASVRTSAERLQGFVKYRVTPDERLVELSNALEKAERNETFEQDLDDFAKLTHDGRVNVRKDAAALQKIPLADWLATLAAGNTDEAEAHMMSRFRETHSVAWLVGALTNADADTPQLTEMLEAAKSVDTGSAAYLSVAFQRDRLLASRGREDDARREIDLILNMPENRIPRSSRNMFLALRMKLARSLDEFLRFAPRVPAPALRDDGIYYNYGDEASRVVPMFDADASIALTEKLPLSALVAAAQSKTLPAGLRHDVAIAAWTRAILLKDGKAARETAPILLDLVNHSNEGKPVRSVVLPKFDLKDAMATYSSSNDEGSREFAAAFILLHAPGMRPAVGMGYSRNAWFQGEGVFEIDGYRDNWWCAEDSQKQFGQGISNAMNQIYPGAKISSPAFLNSAERNAAEKERAVLAALPSAPTWLTERTLAWANTHPEDPRVPEALHFAVRATRFGCGDANTGNVSKRAYMLLHAHYPQSDWSKKTPYWYR